MRHTRASYNGMRFFTAHSQISGRFLGESDGGGLIWVYPNHGIPAKRFTAEEFEAALKIHPYLEDALFDFQLAY